MSKIKKEVKNITACDQTQLKAAGDDDGPGEVSGYASVFNVLDHDKDIMAPGAFKKTLQESGQHLLLWDSHKTQEGSGAIIGKILEVREDSKGLWFRAKLSAVQRAQDIRRKIREGILSGVSIGYRPVRTTIDRVKKARILKEVKLFEISIVGRAANEEAVIVGVKDDTEATRVETALTDFRKDMLDYAAELKERHHI